MPDSEKKLWQAHDALDSLLALLDHAQGCPGAAAEKPLPSPCVCYRKPIWEAEVAVALEIKRLQADRAS